MAPRQEIRQRIGLQGGAEIKKQLEDIGKAGADAFKKLQDAVKANATLERLGPVFDAVRNKAREIGTAFADVGKRIERFQNDIVGAARNIGLIAGALAAAVGGFTLLIKGASDAADALKTTADALGLTTKELSELRFAAEQAGISEDEFTRGIQRFNRTIDESTKKGLDFEKKQRALNREFGLGRITIKQYTERLQEMRHEQSEDTNAFSRLGAEIVKNDDGSVNLIKTLEGVSDQFKTLPDGATKSAQAMEFFGSRNSRFVNFLNQGSVALQRQRKEAERVAPALSKLGEEVLLRLNDQFDALGRAATSASMELRAAFAPVTGELVDALTEAIVRNRTTFILLANDIARKVRPIIADFIALIEGRDEDVKNGFIIKARDAMIEFGAATKVAVQDIILPALRTLLAVLELVAKGINAVFGTEVTGGQIAIALVITKAIGLFGVLRSGISLVIGAIKLLAVAFGGVTLALAGVAFAVGFFVTKFLLSLGSVSNAWMTFWRGMGVIANAVLAGINVALNAVVQFFVSAFTSVQNTIRGIFESIGTFIAEIFNNIVAAGQAAIDAIALFFTSLPEKLAVAFQAAVQFATDAWNAIVAKAREIGLGIVAAFNTAINEVLGFFTGLRDKVLGFFDAIIAKAKEVASAIASAFKGANAPGGKDGGQAQGLASGGPVRGPGTTRSDSILAWLSNKEFVQPARAVEHYGLAFMESIRRLQFPRFDAGGFVDALTPVMPGFPRFADGGAVAGPSGRPMILQLPDGQQITGFTASSGAVEQVTRYATRRSIKSAGRKPSWFAG